MTLTVDLNADMGEGVGDDEALLRIVTSANIACGLHAGDWDTMARTIALAVKNQIGIGAHPGFADHAGFGRHRMDLPAESLANLVRYQVAAAKGMAEAAGGALQHVKLHGAMANMASEDVDMARTCYEAALSVAPDTVIMVLAGTAQFQAAKALRCKVACEIFADRAYNDDATLVDRSLPNAVIHDAVVAGQRMVEMVRAGAIITESGTRIETAIDTICLHGDTPSAVAMAREVRRALNESGVTLARF